MQRTITSVTKTWTWAKNPPLLETKPPNFFPCILREFGLIFLQHFVFPILIVQEKGDKQGKARGGEVKNVLTCVRVQRLGWRKRRGKATPNPVVLVLVAGCAHTAEQDWAKWQQQHACRTGVRKKCPSAPRKSKRKKTAEKFWEPSVT